MSLGTEERDESGVLERFMTDLLVDDYAGAAQERAGARPLRPASLLALLVAAAVGMVIATALISTRLTTAERQQTRTELVDRVSQLSTQVQARQASVDQQGEGVQVLQDRLLAETDSGPERAREIARLEGQAGTVALTGPGLTITVDDAPDAAAGSLNRVLDRDLQDIVNALWRAGATGVAINGQRLTAVSAIRSAGEAILVNYQPLQRPYAVTAVGANAAAADGSEVQRLLGQLGRDYGLVTDARAGDIALPAGDLRSPRFASTTSGGVASS